MEGPSPGDILLLEEFRLDRHSGVLSRKDECGICAPLAIGSRALDILGLLVDRPGNLVSRAEIFSAVWPDTVVEDSNLNVQIAGLRRVLDEGRAEGSCIPTIPGRGYRFVGPVRHVESSGSPASSRPSGKGAGGAFAAPRQSDSPPRAIPLPQRKRLWCSSLALVAVAICLVAAVVTAANWQLRQLPEARLAPRMSIVVLPFTDLSDEADQRQLASSITEDLTTELSPNTAFTYGNRLVDTKQIGRELGVRYALEGSVERSGNRLHVNAELIDTEGHAAVGRAVRARGGRCVLAAE